jgi:hypothetical protein
VAGFESDPLVITFVQTLALAMQHILATTAFAGCRPLVQEGARCQRSTQSPLRPYCSDCRSLLRLQTVRPSLTAVDKMQRIRNVKTGGPTSYVELLSCLESKRDAREVGEGAPLIRSDQPVQSTPRRRR